MSATGTSGAGTHRIAEAGRLSGFSASTLRFYEDVGVVPAARRTASGYRLYDERDVERLRLVARAKALGCTLEEITELVRAWDEGECAPVKHQLQALVDAKFAEVQGLITDQEQFAAELRATAASLDTRSPEGPCDASCACTTAPGPADGAGSVACSLDDDGRQARIEGWQRVLADVVERLPVPGGLRLVLGPSAPVGEISGLAVAENRCCPFFCFAVTVDGRGNALEVTAPAEGQRLLRSIFGGATSPAGR